MPWFLTSIIGKRVANAMVTMNNGRKYYDSRPFGFYNLEKDALKAVVKNRCNMHEALYEFLVIEHIEEGVHPPVENEEWFRWDYKKNCWKRCRRPKQFLGLINFALG